jgi:hypothetical protein
MEGVERDYRRIAHEVSFVRVSKKLKGEKVNNILDMEKFLPLLNTIQTRLRDILTRNRSYMLSWDIPKISSVGDDLIKLAWDVYPALVDAQHRVLSQSLKEAGRGIKNKVGEFQDRKLEDKDKEYFRNVHEALSNICEKIETGEYYQALLRIASRSELSRKEKHYIA